MLSRSAVVNMASVALRHNFVTLSKAIRVIVEIPKFRPANQKSAFSGRSSDIMEAWSARRTCYSFPPAAIPVDSLVHVNFAFASIDRDNFRLKRMDSATPPSLFMEIAHVRTLKSTKILKYSCRFVAGPFQTKAQRRIPYFRLSQAGTYIGKGSRITSSLSWAGTDSMVLTSIGNIQGRQIVAVAQVIPWGMFGS